MMVRSALITAAALAIVCAAALFAQNTGTAGGGQAHAAAPGDLRFEAIDVYIDPLGTPLAAYQVEIRALGGRGRIVGIEGGAHPAYAQPPHYDPRALHDGQINERVVIAALSTADDLPTERTRIATLTMAVQGDAEYQVVVEAAGDAAGARIAARVEIKPAQRGQ